MVDFNSKYSNNANDSTGLMFIKVYNKWHRLIKKELDNLSITHPQYVVLASLNYLNHQHDEVRQIDISSFSDIDTVTVSDILKLLEKKELIERKSSQHDSRAKVVYLTTQGLDVTKKATQIIEKIDLDFFGSLNTEQTNFLSLLQKLI